MSNVSINGLPVVRARVQRPRVGNWAAEVVVDVDTAQQLPNGAAAQLQTDGGALTFSGTVVRSDVYAQLVSLRMVGGKNGLSTPCAPRFYRGTPLQQPLNDVLKDAGEQLASSADPAALQKQLDVWTTVSHQVALHLQLLADAAGPDVVWRVLADGTVFFGTDGYAPTSMTDFELTDYLPLEGIQELASESPTINPGESFNGRNVSDVEHLVDAGRSRVRVWFES